MLFHRQKIAVAVVLNKSIKDVIGKRKMLQKVVAKLDLDANCSVFWLHDFYII